MSALLLAALLPLALSGSQEPTPAPGAGGSEIAARGAGVVVTVDEVEAVLLGRHGKSEQGREILQLLVKSNLLDALATREGIVVGPEDVSGRWRELDRRVREAGEAGGIEAQIEQRGITTEEFREFLRLSIVQERLTRRALGVEDDGVVSEAQQEVWLSQEIATLGLERPAPPWDDGVVARCGDVVVTTGEFSAFLRKRLPPEEIREACWHLLLQHGIERRMPDLSEEALAREVEREIARRRAKHARDYPLMSFEQRLGALGRSVDDLNSDPAVLVASLTHLWVDRTYGDDGVRKAYEDERDLFEGRFGRAARTYLLFLVAGRFVNDLNPRTFEQAEKELSDMARRIGDTNDFEALAIEFSEEQSSRKQKGAIGWLTRNDPGIPPQIREAVFDFLDTGGEVPASGRALGPVRLDSGAALLWLAAERPSPGWEVMREHVHEELRRRLVVDVMPTGAVEILLLGETR